MWLEELSLLKGKCGCAVFWFFCSFLSYVVVLNDIFSNSSKLELARTQGIRLFN